VKYTTPAASKIIPGNWGMGGQGWNARPLQGGDRKVRAAEAGFTSSSGDGRASSVTRFRSCAARGDSKPLRVGSSSPGWFQARVNRSYPEGIRLLLRPSAGRLTLAVSPEVCQTKSAERRHKMSVRLGKDMVSGQDP
jgi:hypothetical protein